MTLRVAIAPIVFVLCIPLPLVVPVLGRRGFAALFVLPWVAMRVYRRRIGQAQAAS
ncbi:hypothetical protein [Xanthomonas theicola]|uniref:hypothetical protein n=1 Tax=Xanthomonas theicola TaxID=56464 RepID=UPI001FE5D11A|nr:hypothetical protein [Xanthomonas theicola]